MRRLVLAFAGRTYHIAGSLMSRLIYNCYQQTTFSKQRVKMIEWYMNDWNKVKNIVMENAGKLSH